MFFVERFLRDLFDTPGLGSVCAGEETKSGLDLFFLYVFNGNHPLEPRFSTQKLIFCLCRDLGEMCLTYQAT